MKIDNRRYALVIGVLIGCAVMFWSGFAFAGAEVSVAGGNWAIGSIKASGVTTSGTEGGADDKWTVTGSSDGTEDIYIKVDGTNCDPGETSGTNQFILKHDVSGSWGDPITNSGDGILLKEDLAQDGTQKFDLQFTAPTGGNEGVQQTLTVTLKATGWAAWACGDTVTFTYRGSSVTYGTVLNETTGECWLNKNLGASRVATDSDDSDAYGDLFQWGRLDDNHQLRDSDTIAETSDSDDPEHDDFITEADAPKDWREPQNHDLWQGVSGINNPCPSGWRIATEVEWEAERASWGSSNATGAFGSPLKLTAGGFRDHLSNFLGVDTAGLYWASTVQVDDGVNAHRLYFDGSTANTSSTSQRAAGGSIRCIKD